MRCVLFVAVFLCAVGNMQAAGPVAEQATTSFATGNDFLRLCKTASGVVAARKNFDEAIFCVGFVDGFGSGTQLTHDLLIHLGKLDPIICIPTLRNNKRAVVKSGCEVDGRPPREFASVDRPTDAFRATGFIPLS